MYSEISCLIFVSPVRVLGQVLHPALLAPEVFQQVVPVGAPHHRHVVRQGATDVETVVLVLVLMGYFRDHLFNR